MKDITHTSSNPGEWNKGVVIDTGPLLLAFAAFHRQDHPDAEPYVLNYITGNNPAMRDPRYARSLPAWLQQQKEVLTTAHVLTEIHRHGQRGKLLRSQDNFWGTIDLFWKSLRIDQQDVRLQDYRHDSDCQEVLNSAGATDTALILPAHSSELPILTDDRRTLLAPAHRYGIRRVFMTDDIVYL